MSGLMYCTPDRINEVSGGGVVTSNELRALCEFSEEQTVKRRDPILSSISVFSRDNLGSDKPEPWKWDDTLVSRQDFHQLQPRLCHFYSGSFPKTVIALKDRGCRISYTVAAHDKEISRQEHEKLGWPFPYIHLTDPKLWKQYIECYRLADVIICPSTVAEKTVRAYGPEFAKKRIVVIPHGCNPPRDEDIKPLPKGKLVVGYCGSFGADKGVRYLLEAWKRLNYRDGSLLILAGRDSTSPIGRHLVEKYGGGNIHLAGWQNDLGDFYNQINLFICPAATEGFNIEVCEAMSYGRPVLCSTGAGASDLVHGDRFAPCDVNELADKIHTVKNSEEWQEMRWESNREVALAYDWVRIRRFYRNLWEEMLQ